MMRLKLPPTMLLQDPEDRHPFLLVEPAIDDHSRLEQKSRNRQLELVPATRKILPPVLQPGDQTVNHGACVACVPPGFNPKRNMAFSPILARLKRW